MNQQPKDGGEEHPLGLFFGGVPPFTLFKMNVDDVTEIVDRHQQTEDEGHIILNKAAELGVIGLVAYFEAFCKHQFAALVHCSPPLLEHFAERRQQAAIPIRDLVYVGDRFLTSVGYVVAERFDFSSGKLINGLFNDLLGVTPLTGEEVLRLDDILNDRHLLIHHDGLYTLEYTRTKKAKGALAADPHGHGPFMGSLVVTKAYYHQVREFMFASAIKIVTVTFKALDTKLRRDPDLLRRSRPDALSYLLWEVEDKNSKDITAL